MYWTGKHLSKEIKRKIRLAHIGLSTWNKGKTKKEFPQLSNSGVKKGNVPWNKGKKLSPSHIENLRKSHLGHHPSKETRLKMSKANKGRIPWNKNKIGIFSEKTLKRFRERSKGSNNSFYGRYHSKETKILMSRNHWDSSGKNHPMYGKHHNKKSKLLISKHLKGRSVWITGLTKETDNRVKQLSESLRGRKFSPETLQKMSNAKRGRKLSSDYIKKCLRRRVPSSLELKFQQIIEKNNLPYRYTGNGSFILERCNPDFINTNNKKIAIEVYAKFYKELDNRNIQVWKRQRTKIFEKYGWQILFFDEIQVNEKYVLSILKEVESK